MPFYQIFLPAFCIAILAAFIFAAIPVFWVWYRKRFKKEKVPISRRLRRTAGHSLRQKLASLEYGLEKAILLVAGGGFLLAATTIALFFTPTPTGQSVFDGLLKIGFATIWSGEKGRSLLLTIAELAIMGTVLLVGGVWSLWRNMIQLRRTGLGLLGEQAVAEVLADAVSYRAYHDVPGAPYGNIDHVAVGPGGVFAIETKTRRKKTAPPGRKDHVVQCDGKAIQFPWGTENKAIVQSLIGFSFF